MEVVQVNRSSIITCDNGSLCIKITCPCCGHENEHGPSEGHRVCDGWQEYERDCPGYINERDCPGYIIRIIEERPDSA